MSTKLIQDLHAGISRRDWSAVETVANRLRDDVEKTVRILAGTGIGSLPNDYPLPDLATAALSAHPSPVGAEGWRLIETVPKDERLIIIGSYNARGQWCAEIWSTRYLRDEQAKIASDFYMNIPHLEWAPTHWADIPASPEKGAGQ